MPKYKVRLESPDHMRENGEPHYRVTSIVADGPEAAAAVCQRREYEKVTYQLPADKLAEYEKAEATALKQKVKAHHDVRARLSIHRQQRPYEIVSVEEVA